MGHDGWMCCYVLSENGSEKRTRCLPHGCHATSRHHWPHFRNNQCSIPLFGLDYSERRIVVSVVQTVLSLTIAMHRTPWSKQTSSLPSDRIPPANRSSPVPRSRAGGKQKDTAPPKSKEVRKLEGLRDGLNNFKGKDPEGGCFCQGTKCYFIIRFGNSS